MNTYEQPLEYIIYNITNVYIPKMTRFIRLDWDRVFTRYKERKNHE